MVSIVRTALRKAENRPIGRSNCSDVRVLDSWSVSRFARSRTSLQLSSELAKPEIEIGHCRHCHPRVCASAGQRALICHRF